MIGLYENGSFIPGGGSLGPGVSLLSPKLYVDVPARPGKIDFL